MANNDVLVGDKEKSQLEESVSRPAPENIYDPIYLKYMIRTDPYLQSEFLEIIGKYEKTCVNVHEQASVSPRIWYSDTYYRHFFSKYVSILQGRDAKSGMLEKHSSIFPFKINSHLQINPLPVTKFFDGQFSSEIKKFVEYHFDNDVELDYLINLFLANIDNFKNRHFKNSPSLRQLIRVIGIGSTWREYPPEYLSDYFKDFIRLNDNGTEWYKYFQTRFNEVCKIYNKSALMVAEKSKSYFKYLPEINCCELLLLLDTDFYLYNRRKYTSLFRKYLFFFGNAIKCSASHPIFFIDETLFACLQFRKKYETFRGPILKLQWELWMITLVHCRKFPIPYKQEENLILDENNLTNVIEYANRIPGIESAHIYYGEPHCPTFKIFLLLENVAFLMGYADAKNGSNYGQIMKSALLNRDIRKLVYYNAFLGEEITCDMPTKKYEIRDFIRKHDMCSPTYPEKFLIHRLQKFFVNLPSIAQN